MPNTEPVVWSNIVSAVMAALGALVALNVISLLPEQMAAIETAIGAILAVAGPLVSMWLGRQSSTPLADPKITTDDGTVVPLVRKDTGQPTPQAIALDRRM